MKPAFQLPFKCGQTWRASTYGPTADKPKQHHYPDADSLDLIRFSSNTNVSANEDVLASAADTVIEAHDTNSEDPPYGSTVAIQHEGHELAKWFADRCIAGIVVKYSDSGNPATGYQFPVPLLDDTRAIRTTRAKAGDWGIDPKKIGIMGFSAGGHLASLATTRFNEAFPEFEGKDAIDQQSARPDFSILIYPVISMDSTLGHGG